jgi:large subunit ribosomal protein L17
MPRKGDNAKMAVIALVSEKTVTREAEAARGTKFAKDEPKVTEVVETTDAVQTAQEPDERATDLVEQVLATDEATADEDES